MKKIVFLIVMAVSIHGATDAQQKVLRHVVMFGWKEGTDTAYLNKIVTAFKALPAKIPTIKSFEWGTNNSPEGLNGGLTHCFIVTFSSEANRDAYLVDPAHKAFVALLDPKPEKVTVLDFWVNP